ncbi:GCN5 family acetyltransferase [Klebsiella sp. RIT-PI-d]|uniref:GNAT family N-acetyltransferase n=1 Tax=Klebsiella sp. RIT-PI-d TaxID=1681196 RepID=UPI0006768476|nr:GNAT family N-acetyltransferase [Klebsiella sp. RIT-PI-d]KNC09372.1 GCN5 family acetyltransferase [Klebsiella sp. RIT-PI-d]
MSTSITLHSFSGDDILCHLDALTDILEDCIAGGASVSFMLPCQRDTLKAWWTNIAQSTDMKERLVLVALDSDQRPIGTVQLILSQPENQPHRADVAKLLVHSRARRQGVAAQLISMLESTSLLHHKTLLVLDTATGSGAEMFYQQQGWHKSGEIPDYALMPDGVLTATSVYYKQM